MGASAGISPGFVLHYYTIVVEADTAAFDHLRRAGGIDFLTLAGTYAVDVTKFVCTLETYSRRDGNEDGNDGYKHYVPIPHYSEAASSVASSS
ncbi:MAG: hypothetical protein ACWGQW_01835, partial [bacterium]